MEVHGRQPDHVRSARERFIQSQRELLFSNRDRARRARKSLESLSEHRHEAAREARLEALSMQSRRPVDAIELSTAAHDVEVDADRAARLEELRDAVETGTLSSPERIERAAEGILRG